MMLPENELPLFERPAAATDFQMAIIDTIVTKARLCSLVSLVSAIFDQRNATAIKDCDFT